MCLHSVKNLKSKITTDVIAETFTWFFNVINLLKFKKPVSVGEPSSGRDINFLFC